MATEKDFNVPPYFDDFDANNRYHRILFRPSVAVQARELTQLQTTLQDQIEKFGNHIFKDGSIVQGCGLVYYPNVHFISLDDRFNTNIELFPTDLTTNTEFQYLVTNSEDSDAATRAVIKIAKTGSKNDPPNTNRIYLDYISTGTDPDGNDVPRFRPGDTLYIYTQEQNKFSTLDSANLFDSIQTLDSNSTFSSDGYAYCIGVSEGIVFQKGFFVQVEPHTITIRDYSNQVDGYVVGFDTIEEIYTENNDNTLNDNALGYDNENAPGAHRLKLIPTLVSKTRADAANNKNFFALVEFDGNEPTEQRDGAQYNELNKQFALRTYEESGDYFVYPFIVDTLPYAANSQYLTYQISPGIAYVRGSRVEKIGTTSVVAPRAIDTNFVQNQTLTANYGNYVICNEFLGAADLENMTEVSLYDTAQRSISEYESVSASPSGSVMGKANVRAVVFEQGTKGTTTAKYLVYLFNIRMNAGYSFSQVKSLYGTSGTAGNFKCDVVLENGVCVLKESSKNNLLLNTGLLSVKSLTNNTGIGDTYYVYNQIKTATLAVDGTVSVSLDTAGPGTSTEKLNSASGTTLTGSSAEPYNIYLSQNAYSSNLTGNVSFSTTSVTVSGTGTSFLTSYQVGSLIYLYANTTTAFVRRVESIANNESLTVDALPAYSNTDTTHARYFVGGSVLPLTAVNINSNTAFTANTDLTIASGTQSVYCSYPVNRNLALSIPKVINKSVYVKISCASDQTGPWNLGLCDVHKIRHVYVGTGTYSTTNADRLSWFTFDDGQKDDMYDHAKLVVKPEYKSKITSSTTILVELDAFTANTTASVGFFSVESYPIDDNNTSNTNAIQTIELPKYKGNELRNFIDFRPRKYNTANVQATSIGDATLNPATNTMFDVSVSPSGQYTIIPDSNFVADFEYYMPRIDLITIDPFGTFNVIRGVPSNTPKTPSSENDQSIVCEVFIPAYPSASKREADQYTGVQPVKVLPKQNRRYTMKDIGALDERIKRVEYYTVLNTIEQQARDLTIPDASGLNRFKNGIFADPFNSHNIGNVADFEYKIAIDPKETVARPYFDKHDVDFQYTGALSSNTQVTGPIVTLPYTHVNSQSQRFATKYRNTTQSLWKWNGFIDLYPSSDFYRDEEPPANISLSLDIAAPWEQFVNSPFGSLYGDWRTVSVVTNTSVSSSTSGFITTTNTTRTTTETQNQIVTNLGVNTFTEQLDFGTTVKDISIQPYMRSRLVSFVARNMKPNTTLHAFFDDVSIDQYCAPGVLSGVTSVAEGFEDRFVTQNGNFGDPLVSDANGFICGVFRIPAETFRTGDRVFLLTDVDSLELGADAFMTTGRARYTADAVSVTKQSTTLNVRQPILFRNSITNTRSSVTSNTRTVIIDNTPNPEPWGGGGDGDSGGGCFVKGSMVLMANGESIAIEQVKVGDRLVGKDRINTVLEVSTPSLRSAYPDGGLFAINDGKAFVTAEHPFLTQQGWKAIDPSETTRLKPGLAELNITKLMIGDRILSVDGTTEVLSIQKYHCDDQTLYNFRLDGDQCYFVNGLLVHNKPIAQSFEVINVPANVSGIFLTKVGVYFKKKDSTLGCQLFICEMVNGFPDFSRVLGKCHLPSSSISVSDNATTETVFTLEYPIFLLKNNDYAMVIQPDGYSPEYQIWVSETGNVDIATGEQVYSNPWVGTLFYSGNRKTWTDVQLEDIKFKLYRAAFTANSGYAIFNNETDEYLTVDGFTKVNTALSVSVGDVVYTVNSSADTANVQSIVSNTLSTMVYGRVQYVNEATGKIWLDSSTASPASYFSNTTNPTIAIYRISNPTNTSLLSTNTLIAHATIETVDNLTYHAVVPKFGTLQPSSTTLNYEFKGTSTSNTFDSFYRSVENNNELEYNDVERHAMSKSNEVLSLDNTKSSQFKVNMRSYSTFVSPVINLSAKSMLFIENLINNDTTNEHTRYGNALTKYVSKTMILDDGQEAEDLKVYLTAFRPSETDIKVYAKFWNNQDPEPFDDKVWTELQYDNGGELVYSSPSDTRDYIEYQFSVPSTNSVAQGAFANSGSDTLTVLSGTISISNNSNEITGTSTSFTTEVSVGDRIRIVSDDYFAIRTITSIANNTSLFVDNGVTQTNSASLAYVFDQIGNEGIVEYKNSADSRMIGFKQVAFKVVLLSSNPVKVPMLNDIRAICLQI
jgi:hypothetical protein